MGVAIVADGVAVSNTEEKPTQQSDGAADSEGNEGVDFGLSADGAVAHRGKAERA